MDPADMESFRQALSTQGALVGEHSQALREMMEAFNDLSIRVTQMGAQLDLLVSHTTASPPATTVSASCVVQAIRANYRAPDLKYRYQETSMLKMSCNYFDSSKRTLHVLFLEIFFH
ncbi:unnamed protein product [Arctogadus glacialis]